MKKFKSLLSLLFVMVFMLQLAGPVAPEASAYGNNSFTVTANAPVYDPGSKSWVANSYVLSDVSGFNEADYNIIIEIAVTVNGTTVTATPSLKEFSTKSDGADRRDTLAYQQPKMVPATATLSAITVKATEPAYYNGTYTSSFELVSGEMHSSHSFGNWPVVSVSSDGNTVVADASGVQIVNNLAQDVTGKYVITTQNATRNVSTAKPALTVTAAAPRMDSQGIIWCPGPETPNVKLTIDGAEIDCLVTADGSVTDNGANVIGTLSNVKVFTTKNNGTQVDITDKVNITTASSSWTKPTLTVTLNAPKYDGTKFINNSYSYEPVAPKISMGGVETQVTSVSLNTGKINVTDNGSSAVATASASDVVVMVNSIDVSKGFNIVMVNGVHNKPTINIYPNTPVQNADGTYSSNGFADDTDRLSPKPAVTVVDWIISGNAVTPGTVVVKDGNTGTVVTPYYNVVKHTTYSNGSSVAPGGNGGTTVPTGTVIKTASNSWIYDGQPHSQPTYDTTTLPAGWSISGGVFKNSITNVGTVANEVDTATVVVKDASGNVVPSSQYTIQAGTITVTKRPLTIQATSAGKTPNGYAFSEKDAKGVKFANSTSLVAGHTLGDGLKIQYVLGSTTYTDYKQVTASGTYIKDLVVYSAKVVVDAYGNDMTNNYDISAVDGTLTISSGWVSPDTGDYSNIGLWIALLGISAVAVAAVVVIVLKKNKKA